MLHRGQVFVALTGRKGQTAALEPMAARAEMAQTRLSLILVAALALIL